MKNKKNNNFLLKIKWENIAYLCYMIGSVATAIKRSGIINLVDNISTVLLQALFFLMFWFGIRWARKNPQEFTRQIKELIEDNQSLK